MNDKTAREYREEGKREGRGFAIGSRSLADAVEQVAKFTAEKEKVDAERGNLLLPPARHQEGFTSKFYAATKELLLAEGRVDGAKEVLQEFIDGKR